MICDFSAGLNDFSKHKILINLNSSVGIPMGGEVSGILDNLNS